MTKLRNIKKIKLLVLFVLIVNFFAFVSPLTSPIKVDAKTTEELQAELDALNQQLNEISNQKNTIQGQLDSNNYVMQGMNSQLSKLYGETEVINREVQELDLQIKQLEIQINLLNEQIAKKQEEIKQTELTIADLEDESQFRIKDGYFNYRVYNTGGDAGTTLFNLTNINAYFKSSQYKEIIQSDTNTLMVQVAELKQSLQDKKQQLDLDVIAVNKDKEIVDVKKIDLSKKKDEADAKIQAYLISLGELQAQNNSVQAQLYQFNEAEAQKRAEANLVQQELFSSYIPPSGGQFVLAGTYIGKQGCTGLCSGPHLHFMVGYGGLGSTDNPCFYLKPGVINGCGGGNLDWPLRGNLSFNSSYGDRCFWWGSTYYCDFHNAIDIAASPWNAPVFAAHDGYVYQGVDPYGANYVKLCDNPSCTGLNTGYWHLSEF